MYKSTYIFAALVGVLLLRGAATATTYYVATNGSDSWPGTSSQPWATIQYAVDTISDGDTIIVKSGTYVGCRIENSGSSSAPKTLKSETQYGAVLNNKSSRAKHNGILEVELYDNTISYWVIDGFEVDGVSKTYRCIDARVTDHITVKNCKTHDAYMTGIMTAFCDNILVENNVSYSNGEHGQLSRFRTRTARRAA